MGEKGKNCRGSGKGGKKVNKSITNFSVEDKEQEEKLESIPYIIKYTLGDRAIKSLPLILLKEYNIKIRGKLKRAYIKIGKKYIEVDIYGKGIKNGKEYTIIGESMKKI